jgi:hypothetical protein
MATDRSSHGVRIPPNEERVIWRGEGATAPATLLIYADQQESTDDGGSQSPLGTLRIGSGSGAIVVDFDIREGTAVPAPQMSYELVIRNCNNDGQPDVTSRVVLVAGSRPTTATRTYDIGYGMENPNLRAPAFADRVSFDHGLSDHTDYRALLSDSSTGETYGLLPPNTVRYLDRRTRFVRFMGLPEGSLGTVTFFLAL